MNARHQRGFTLLEVMIAIAVLSIALMLIMRVMQQAILASQYEQQQIIAATLARYKMVEIELKLEKDGFPSDDGENCGKFGEEIEDAGFEAYEYCWAAKKIELPLPTDMLGGGDDDDDGAAPASAIPGLDPKAAGEQLGKAVRAIKLVIKWNKGEKQQQLPVVMHLANTTQTQVLP